MFCFVTSPHSFPLILSHPVPPDIFVQLVHRLHCVLCLQVVLRLLLLYEVIISVPVHPRPPRHLCPVHSLSSDQLFLHLSPPHSPPVSCPTLCHSTWLAPVSRVQDFNKIRPRLKQTWSRLDICPRGPHPTWLDFPVVYQSSCHDSHKEPRWSAGGVNCRSVSNLLTDSWH